MFCAIVIKRKWVSDDNSVFAFLGQVPKYVNVKITGNVGVVDRILWLGAIG